MGKNPRKYILKFHLDLNYKLGKMNNLINRKGITDTAYILLIIVIVAVLLLNFISYFSLL